MSGRTRRFVDLTPFRVSGAFARLWIGQALTGIGAQMTIVAVGLQIFAITHDTLAVGLVGGIALIPMLIAGPWGGMLADAFDRRTVLLTSVSVSWLSTLGLVTMSLWNAHLQTTGGNVAVWPFYLFTTLNAVTATISGATRMSVYPRILPPEQVAQATALGGIAMGVQITFGPALAGVLVATAGFPVTFATDAVLALAGFLGVLTLPKLPPLHESVVRGWAAIRQGLDFLRTAPNLRTTFALDLIAMGLGRPYALLPAVAAGVIGGGPTTVGILTAAGAIGTFSTSLFSGPVGHVHRYGVAIGRAVTIYGVCVAAFGGVVLAGLLGAYGPVGNDWAHVSWFGLGLGTLCFVGMGASDEVSAIFRSTMMLTAAPDEMRGRLQGVFFAVVAGGPRMGDLFAGIMATAIALWAPPLLGGLGIVVCVAVLLRMRPAFRSYDKREPTL